MTDNEAMECLQKGDNNALSIVYERHKTALYSFAFHQVQDRFTAEDLVQNTFMKILKYADRYKPDSNFKAWMFTIARNLLKDHYRKSNTVNMIKTRVREEAGTAVSNHGGEMALARQEKKELLWKMLSTLDQDKREILVLVKLNEMKYKEVAQITGMAEGHLRIMVFRTMKELQRKFNSHKKHIQH